MSNFRIIEEGLFSLRLGWTPPLGKLNGFKIFIPRCTLTYANATIVISRYIFVSCVSILLDHNCFAANRPGFTYEQLLPGDTSSHVIDSLEEDKKYTISIYVVYPEGPSEPVSVVGKTCEYFCFGQNIMILIYINKK